MARKSKLEKTVDKQRKNHPVAFFLVVLFLLLGALGGYFTLKFLTKEDCFLVLGEQTIYLDLGESFVDDGVKIIAFGKDISSNVKIERDENFMTNLSGLFVVGEGSGHAGGITSSGQDGIKCGEKVVEFLKSLTN